MSSASPDLRSGRDGELGRNGRRTGSIALHLCSELELANPEFLNRIGLRWGHFIAIRPWRMSQWVSWPDEQVRGENTFELCISLDGRYIWTDIWTGRVCAAENVCTFPYFDWCSANENKNKSKWENSNRAEMGNELGQRRKAMGAASHKCPGKTNK